MQLNYFLTIYQSTQNLSTGQVHTDEFSCGREF